MNRPPFPFEVQLPNGDWIWMEPFGRLSGIGWLVVLHWTGKSSRDPSLTIIPDWPTFP